MTNLRFVKELFGPHPLARCQWVGAIQQENALSPHRLVSLSL